EVGLGDTIAQARVIDLVLLLTACEQGLDLRSQPLLLLHHAAVAHRLVLARVRLDLAAVERDVPELRKPGAPADLDDLDEQRGDSVQVDSAEVGDRREVGMLVPGEVPERYVLVGLALDLARREHCRCSSRTPAATASSGAGRAARREDPWLGWRRRSPKCPVSPPPPGRSARDGPPAAMFVDPAEVETVDPVTKGGTTSASGLRHQQPPPWSITQSCS